MAVYFQNGHQKNNQIDRENRCLSIQTVDELPRDNRYSVLQLLHESFNMRKVCSKMVQTIFTLEQKEVLTYIALTLYSSDLAQYDVLYTQKLKGTRFETVEAVKTLAAVMVKLPENDWQHCI